MVRCRMDCLHRTDVHNYRSARAADEARLESETGMYPGDIRLWKESNTMINFRIWLEGKRR